ncbi:2-ketoarginine methyltransferase [Chondromyces crocatus]|uniref:2-ketoarginine methyltransferase n=1 Tax=Chondromyces crocatus TaxID=52 RepID=UPI001C54F7B3|nr:2-ketoarginine methyltransferase [Chondromyces crocatus]
MTESFEARLIEGIQPLRQYVLSINIYHLFETGLFDLLLAEGGLAIEAIAERKAMEPDRLRVFLGYLRNEGYLSEVDGKFSLADKARKIEEFRPWYTMFVGGYDETYMQIGEKLSRGSGWASRNLAQVGNGSCGISRHDAIPLTRKLMAKVPGRCTRLLDMGCGNGRYLVEFCEALPEIQQAWGVEPSAESCREAEQMIARHGLQDRVHIVNASAGAFLHAPSSFEPDFVVLGFVLHEILGQEGPAGVRAFLTQMVERFPHLHLIIIEVDQQLDSPQLMQHGLGLAYYNPYYLAHPFTQQRLETPSFWEGVFAECDLEVVAKEFTDPEVDSTGMEVGYLLRKRGS